MWIDDFENLKFPTEDCGGFLTSILGTKVNGIGEGRLLTYANERDVQSHCQMIMDDALLVLGLTQSFVEVNLSSQLWN
jgi:hypothetical protein